MASGSPTPTPTRSRSERDVADARARERTTAHRRDLRASRLRGPATALAMAAATVAALGQALGTVVAGSLAEGPTRVLVGALALCLAGGALLDAAGRTVWAAVVDRAEGRLRADLVTAALLQPLGVLSDQAVGEILDRVDDDTHEIGSLLRSTAWDALRTALVTVPLWIIAGLTWWPAWLIFPVVAAATLAAVRPLLGEVSRRKILEEMAWTDHAAVMEEGIAGRDDLRTSLGQPFLARRSSELAARVHARFDDVLGLETQMTLRAGVLLHALLAGIALSGVALVAGGRLSIGSLVTLFLVTSTFVGQIDQLARHLPDLQAGLGAVVRLRQLLEAPEEPAGGVALPEGPLDLELRDLHFSYGEGGFALAGVDLRLAAGRTCALVGRTGSGKSTLASLVSRAVDPPPGSLLLGGVDVLDLDLDQLRRAVGVVSQRTEILAGTLAENVALFGEVPRERVEAAMAELGLQAWVTGLPLGLDTPLGPGGTTLSAGEEQLVAFARLLVREVRVVVLDEATARMDPHTEAQVVRAADRLLRGRTGLLVAHRLATIERAEHVLVLEAGRVVQQGDRATLTRQEGPLRRLLQAASPPAAPSDATGRHTGPAAAPGGTVGGLRRIGEPPARPDVGHGASLSRTIVRVLSIHPWWGLLAAGLFSLTTLVGAYGALTGLAWGRVVQGLRDDGASTSSFVLTGAVVLSLMAAPLLLAAAIRRYPRWWVAVMLRVRTAVLLAQTEQQRLVRTPPGEAVARALDADRLARYADRWVDLVNGVVVVVVTTLLSGSLITGLVLGTVLGVSALASALGSPVAGRSAAAASLTRARFGRSLVSVLESARTVKLAAATDAVHGHLLEVDRGRVDAAVREHRVQALLAGVPVLMVQCGVVASWAVLLLGGWDLATTLLVAAAVTGFDWFGRVAGAVITEAPGVRSWARATSRLAGGGDLMALPAGLDLVTGAAPAPAATPPAEPLRELRLSGFAARHDDGTVGVRGVDLHVGPGELVMLLGQVGSGKSSLLGALAGLVEHTGTIWWNDEVVTDPQRLLRPGRVAHVAQVPRVLSGTFADNVLLDHAARRLHPAVADARLGRDLDEAGGPEAVVGHRGVRLSGGQVQRLALARALATGSELLLADDVSSALDAATEVELWEALRARGTAVLGSTSKRAALERADRVVVLLDGEVAASGPWADLVGRWGHLGG